MANVWRVKGFFNTKGSPYYMMIQPHSQTNTKVPHLFATICWRNIDSTPTLFSSANFR